jgi:hypothetical protein
MLFLSPAKKMNTGAFKDSIYLQAMKPSLLMLILVAAASCIEPYNPDIKNYKSLLVVEGLVTNENSSYVFRLSRTMDDEEGTLEMISDAVLYLTDENDTRTDFHNCENGIYKTDSLVFTGQLDRTYTLHIILGDGREYVSDPCTMYPVSDIDNVYYEKAMEFSGTSGKSIEGIRIFVVPAEPADNVGYLRWEYDEIWKTVIASPPKYVYVTDTLIIPLENVNSDCWKINRSKDILISSYCSLLECENPSEPVLFIGTGRSDRLTVQYSLLVKQYSISADEYEFWKNLQEINESGGDIFDSQPFPVYSNIHNINDPDEMVLGYFEVSAVKSKRIFITPAELDDLDVPRYVSDCTTFPVSPLDYHVEGSMAPVMTFDELYEMFMDNGKYTFIEPIYNSDTKQLEKLAFAYNACSTCEPYGTSTKPGFWIDLK